MNKVKQSTDINLSPATIHQSEQGYFDQKAEKELENLEDEQLFIDPANHGKTLKLWGFDGNLSGKKVMDCGCGTGFFSVLMAKIGADVCCFDLSPKNIDVAKKRADLNKVGNKIKPTVATFEDLDYKDESFDLIVGKNILHHIPDIEDAGRQIRRLLKKGGRAVFYELSANNPILIAIRNHVIGKSKLIPKLGTPDEHPLTKDEVEALSAIFEHRCRISYPKFRFFGKLDRQVFKQRYRPISFLMNGIDRMIFIFFPFLRKYSYKILLEFTK